VSLLLAQTVAVVLEQFLPLGMQALQVLTYPILPEVLAALGVVQPTHLAQFLGKAPQPLILEAALVVRERDLLAPRRLVPLAALV
jgi:hypothetical protein